MRLCYAFNRVREGEKEWGVVYGDSPEEAMACVLGSHPREHGVTYAMVYLPDYEKYDPNSDYTREYGDLK